ncbi:MAG: cupredoxin domain-containing protein [Acidimicrobiales bacterium]
MRKAWMILLAGVLVLTACGSDPDDSGLDDPVAGGSATTAHDDHGGGSADCAASTSLSVTAQNTAYNTACLAVPSGQTFTLALDNKDAGLPHSIALLPGHESNQIFASTGIFPGVANKSVTVTADKLPGKGTYHFHCEVHPTTMMGTFIVK